MRPLLGAGLTSVFLEGMDPGCEVSFGCRMGRLSSETGHLVGVGPEIAHLEVGGGYAVLKVEPVGSTDGSEGISRVLFPY